jgi:hypothetical protein
VSVWYGLFAPAGTPKEIVQTLANAVVRATRDPENRRKLLEQGAEPVGSTPEEFARVMREEVARWAEVVKVSGARADRTVNRPSKMGAWLCWILTVGCCLGPGARLQRRAALAISGLATLLGGVRRAWQWLVAGRAAPAALAVIGNVWMLWGGSRACVLAVVGRAVAARSRGTFAFGAYVCVDVWD